jgi:hypothetical protein
MARKVEKLPSLDKAYKDYTKVWSPEIFREHSNVKDQDGDRLI